MSGSGRLDGSCRCRWLMSSWADRSCGGRQPESWLLRSSTSTRVSFACPIDLVMSRWAFCWMRYAGTYDPHSLGSWSAYMNPELDQHWRFPAMVITSWCRMDVRLAPPIAPWGSCLPSPSKPEKIVTSRGLVGDVLSHLDILYGAPPVQKDSDWWPKY
jgi:hypothetical protein